LNKANFIYKQWQNSAEVRWNWTYVRCWLLCRTVPTFLQHSLIFGQRYHLCRPRFLGILCLVSRSTGSSTFFVLMTGYIRIESLAFTERNMVALFIAQSINKWPFHLIWSLTHCSVLRDLRVFIIKMTRRISMALC